MNNLTKQLANLYEPKWKELKPQLDAQAIKVQAPFMLGVALEHVHQGGYTDESWWTDADLKVMVFGQGASCLWYEDGSQLFDQTDLLPHDSSGSLDGWNLRLCTYRWSF